MSLYAPVGPGELIDKITILELKAEEAARRDRLSIDKLAREKLAHVHVRAELAELIALRDEAIPPSPALAKLTASLSLINQTLWWVEDELRAYERAGDFGVCFIALARSVYRLNDQRASAKRRINELLQAAIVEEKFYVAY